MICTYVFPGRNEKMCTVWVEACDFDGLDFHFKLDSKIHHEIRSAALYTTGSRSRPVIKMLMRLRRITVSQMNASLRDNRFADIRFTVPGYRMYLSSDRSEQCFHDNAGAWPVFALKLETESVMGTCPPVELLNN
ncbi:uncharacterized protein LOC141900380 [Tubulanus polymorphus]|uniref:uncharacterized protein LOC141900380 n=1 Tax=Tubulanus polymorphus TaxID=672921 RepID=UPI003DA26ABE